MISFTKFNIKKFDIRNFRVKKHTNYTNNLRNYKYTLKQSRFFKFLWLFKKNKNQLLTANFLNNGYGLMVLLKFNTYV